ncbi:MAG: outer membrane protein transport protein [Candidatus Tectomicrobia bacterium]|uniref:Outer membrane protein transport protein n=1 Tax=Tectimicrobiota bacterium TaxID=2528274 RepID=A0A932CPR1_UNCTE|nr:outer membrane protein transport protein [Candidatus Tectomicrobia bacterium]
MHRWKLHPVIGFGFVIELLLLLLPSGAVEGGGYYFYGLGNKAGSMGYSFIGLADDPSAIYWNPAGLVQMREREVGGGFWLMYEYAYRDNNSVANKDPRQQPLDPREGDFFFRVRPAEPSRFRNNEVIPPLANMADLAGHWEWKGFHFGAGYYVPIGTSLDWRDDVHPQDARMDGRMHNLFFLAVNNVSVARELLPGLSLGMGFNFLWGKMNQDLHKAWLDLKDPRNNYSYDMEMNAWGRGVEGVFGVLYRPTSFFQIGGVYRTGGIMNFRGRATGHHTVLNGMAGGRPRQEGADFIWKLNHPPTWGMGLALRPHRKLLLTLDWQHISWTKADLRFHFRKRSSPSILFRNNIDMDTDWEEEDNFNVGLQYQMNDRWQFRMGYGAIHGPTSGDHVGIGTLIVVDNVPTLTFGVNYTPRGPWSYGLHSEYHFEPHDRTASHNCAVLGFGVSRRF